MFFVAFVERLIRRVVRAPISIDIESGYSDDPQTVAISHAIHEYGFWLLIAVVLAHAGAAFYHHLFQRDATLSRMLPRGWLASPQKD